MTAVAERTVTGTAVEFDDVSRVFGTTRALAQLDVSDDVTVLTHQAASKGMAGVAAVLERGRATGPMRDAPLGFVVALANALAEATIDFIIRDPSNGEAHGTAGFDALWRMVA